MGTQTAALVEAVHSRLDQLDAHLPSGAEAIGFAEAIQGISAAADEVLLVPPGPGAVHSETLRSVLERLDRVCSHLEDLLASAEVDPVPTRAIIAVLTAAADLATAVLGTPEATPLAQTA